eukprot:6190860-Pleurochrysis_carterae.AAC.1
MKDSVTRIVDRACADVREKYMVRSATTDSNNLMALIVYAMEAVDGSRLDGPDKKEAVTEIVKGLLNYVPLDDYAQRLCMDMIDQGVVGHLIDVIVAASRGEVNVNATMKVGKSVCTSSAPYLGRI